MEIPHLPAKYRDIVAALEHAKKEDPSLRERAEERALLLFQLMAQRVPAYKKILEQHGLRADEIKSFEDFKRIPLIDKAGYLRAFPLSELCWDGDFRNKSWDIASTSGSTGEPFYFPRTDEQNKQYAVTAEMYLRENFEIHKKSTLYINCFALGVWIGGIFTHEALKLVAQGGKYPLTVISPGLNKLEIIKTVKNLGPHFDQVILGGYPPFIKDVIDDGTAYGLKWKRYNIGIVFSAEGFSEDFRKYVSQKAGVKNIFTGSLNHYGTVDQGTLAHETPLTTLIRRIAVNKPKVFNAIFRSGINRLPTLCQYDPELFFFEEINDGVVCSAFSGLPLVRYDLKDQGGVHTFEEMVTRLKSAGIDIYAEAEKAGIKDKMWRLPFVYVYERKDMSVSFSGANVYPETIRKTLHDKELRKFFTGKCVLEIKHDAKQNPHLYVHVELKNGIAKLNQKIKQLSHSLVLKHLLKDNSEFRSAYHDQRAGQAKPHLVFWPYEHSQYFRLGGKQKWSIKTK